MSKAPTTPPHPPPRISEKYIDVPSQRLYSLSIGALLQAIKIFDFFRFLFSDGQQARYTFKWLIWDFIYCAGLSHLRIPRLNYAKSVVLLQICVLWLLDGFLFGGITVDLGLGMEGLTQMIPRSWLSNPGDITSTAPTFSFSEVLPALGLGGLIGNAGRDAHLLGQHTVRMSPISTAQVNPYAQTFCIASPGQSVLVPILLNNTNPANVKYTLTPLGFVEDPAEEKTKSAVGKVERLELGAKDLKAIEHARQESLQVARTAAAAKRDPDDYDEYDDEDEEVTDTHGSHLLQKSQSLVYVRVAKPGVLRLENVLDSSNVDARLVYPTDVPIVPCPRAVFSESGAIPHGDNMRCAAPGLKSGAGENLELNIDVYGVPPLSLKWHREINGKREPFMVEGIEGEDFHSHRSSGEKWRLAGSGRRAPQQLTIPLTVTLDSLGTHSYVLESVSDALGNIISAGSEGTAPSVLPYDQVMRSITVLRRPTVSFKHCGAGSPASLLIGSDTSLAIGLKEADNLDAPWDIDIRYNPPADEDASKAYKKLKPWKKTVAADERRELTLQATAPGEYHIASVKGQFCEGDVLSPDTCKVVERPMPTAEIGWKKIHECSGDTGVSASLVFHGAPPFHVYYTVRKDKGPAVEKVKIFSGSRGELTDQPPESGHYTFTFTQLSDANYKRVDLKGPTIDQVIHPQATADFAHNVAGVRGRKKFSNCEGNTTKLDVDLKGTGPWTLYVQVVGPKGSEIIPVRDIQTPRKTIEVSIPPAIDRNGGSFEVDLVSVEDSYGCKRDISVPGVVVNVRRVKPTAKFYGAANKRSVTILEGEQATLPLRLTGDGPWRLKYRRAEASYKTLSATLSSANDELRVTDKGTYELLEVSDSQCPGTIVQESKDYAVDWVTRPVAKLSPDIQATYESYNGSHILPPICEGLNDHVDLDLTGRPPFQLMYNVARDNENGGTTILDQPTFSSIQPRTRFQLHTSDPARIYYEVKQVGDAAYPLARNKDAIIPRSQRLLFEQQVLMRPSARFKTNSRITYCLNDALTPHDSYSSDGAIVFSGTAPFHVQLSIRNLAASEVHHETVVLNDPTWKLNIPSYTFKSIGPHVVTIESVQDASGCEQAAPDPLYRNIWLDVAETAAIVPFDRKEHFCVGDVSRFQLEGTPPWTIGYRVNGKLHTQEARVSPFSIIQQQPGEFAVTSIAHQQKLCKTAVTDLRYTVHPLPSAQVGHGKRIVQDIHEGDQAEIVFTLGGEPPFTFTYQRAELGTKKGVQGKVLETHTVSGVTTKEYSIFSALEGIWTVTFISDRYCRYPPAQDGTVERSRR